MARQPGPGAQLFAPAVLPLSLFVIASALLGGGPGGWSAGFALWSVIALVMLVATGLTGGFGTFGRLPLIARVAMLGWVALPFLQLLPLPPGVWQALPGGELRLAVMREFGMASSWMPLSMSPGDTAYTAAVAIVMMVALLAMLRLSGPQFRVLCWLLVGLVGLGAAIGVIQYGSTGTTLQFYRHAHRASLIGFFANKNHMGLVLACMIPMLYALVLSRPKKSGAASSNASFALVSIAFLIMALIIATNSRAALGLGLLALLAALVRSFPDRRLHLVGGAVAAAAVGALLIAFVPTIGSLFDRFGATGEYERLDILARAWPVMTEYWRMGAGFGTFAIIYNPTEALSNVAPPYLNQMHNDWLELVVEGGVPMILLQLCSIAAVIAGLAGYWRLSQGRARTSEEVLLAWAGLIIVLLFGLHSIVDYPGRRIASLLVLMFGLAMVFRPLVGAGRAKAD